MKNTVIERMEILRNAMLEFETKRENNYAYIAGVYSSLLYELASDRGNDFTKVLYTLQELSKSK